MLKRLLRDPLSHFVIIGSVIYVGLTQINPSDNTADSDTIVVTKVKLISLMQKRDQVFKQELYQSKFAKLNDEEKASLLRQYVEEESLYREAKKLGLDQNDEVYRRRLIQKMKYFLEGFAATETSLNQAEFRNYYNDNIEDYREPALISFTHFFYKADSNNTEQATALANSALLNVADNKVPDNTDHFPYHKNYIGKTQSQVSRHFGPSFAKQVFTLQSSDTLQGPITSAYGAHLISVSRKQASHLPEFEQVQTRVIDDARRADLAKNKRQQIDQLLTRYSVQSDLQSSKN